VRSETRGAALAQRERHPARARRLLFAIHADRGDRAAAHPVWMPSRCRSGAGQDRQSGVCQQGLCRAVEARDLLGRGRARARACSNRAARAGSSTPSRRRSSGGGCPPSSPAQAQLRGPSFPNRSGSAGSARRHRFGPDAHRSRPPAEAHAASTLDRLATGVASFGATPKLLFTTPPTGPALGYRRRLPRSGAERSGGVSIAWRRPQSPSMQDFRQCKAGAHDALITRPRPRSIFGTSDGARCAWSRPQMPKAA